MMLDTFKNATPKALAAVDEEKKVRHTNEVFLLFAMGSQFDHLIYQAISKLGVYCLVADPASVKAEDVMKLKPTGIIGSGGPASVISEPPPFDAGIFDLGIPFLGICLSFQMWAKHIGVCVCEGSEFGVHQMRAIRAGKKFEEQLFDGCGDVMQVLQSHGERVETDMRRLTILGVTENEILAAAAYRNLYGVQFHPEVSDTPQGFKVFENFCFKICGAKDRFPAKDIAKLKIEELRRQTEGRCVLLLLSGGSDSSTTAYLFKEALEGKKRLRGLYIKGIDRPDDEKFVERYFGGKEWIEVAIFNATNLYLKALAGKTTMKEKRLAMRDVYKFAAEEEAENYAEELDLPVVIAQGTLYTDISEMGGGHQGGARKATIKIHHNPFLDFRFPEITPLADCVKDGGRDIGRQIGVPEELLIRHPFPGPGLVVRIEGEITAEKLTMARQLDGIYIEELRNARLYDKVWQAGAVVTSSMHTYTKGDDAGMGVVVAYWAVWSINGFTAQAADLPFEFRKRFARRVGNEVRGVGAVVYRDSDKPFSTIEWG